MRFLLLLILVYSVLSTRAQFPKDDFASPVNISIALSGNFGEIRSGHFHAGLDIKTQGKEGLPILASADGYVSRIKVSLYGYGKALYITHPNGYTTVYAHLQRFNDDIEAYVRNQQYARESFEIELYPQKGALTVEQGAQIALSGNSGGSGGPHLHFEIRESGSEIPINPLKTNLPITDNIAPKLLTLSVYPLNAQSHVNGQNQPLYLDLVRASNNTYRINSQQKIEVNGKIGFGIEAIDNVNGSTNRCGVYSIELQKNGVPVYEHEMDKIGFHETRYINSHVDYFGWKKLNKRVQRSFLEPNNKLGIYNHMVNKGQLFFLDDTTFQLEYLVKDAAGNLSTVAFEVISTSRQIEQTATAAEGVFFDHKIENYVESPWFTAQFPAYVFYDDVYFKTSVEPHNKSYVSPIFHLADLYTPLQSYFTLNVKLDSLTEYPKEKLLILALDDKLEVLAPEGGNLNNSQLSIKTRSLGPYVVAIDTTAPTIIPLQPQGNTLRFKIEDELSGVESYNGYANDKWLLFEYDRKTGLFFYEKDERWPKDEKVELTLKIADTRRNLTQRTFTY